MKNQQLKYQIGDKTTTNLQRVYNYMSRNGITKLNSLKIEAKPAEAVKESKESLKDVIMAVKETKDKIKAVKAKSENLKQIINTKN